MIDLKTRDGIAVVSIRHGRANALDTELCDGLAKCFAELRTADARAVVLTGDERMFSAGVDLLRVSAGGIDYVRSFLPALDRLYEAVFFHPKPMVAAINGHAIAGGCVLACCADRRIMARGSGRIGVTELLVGVPFPALALEVMRYAVPSRYFSECTFGGATYDGDNALQRGLVDEAVEGTVLMQHATATATKLAALSPAAFAQTKEQIRLPVRERLEHSRAAVDKMVTEIWGAPDTLHRVRDYVARTLKKA